MESHVSSRAALGFVAAETSTCDELARAAEFCAESGSTLVVSSRDAPAQVSALRKSSPKLSLIADGRAWHTRYATEDEPTLLDVGLPLFTLKEWTKSELRRSGATAVLTPTYLVKAGDRAALQSVLRATTGAADIAGLVTLVAIDAQALTTKNVDAFIEDLSGTPDRQLAFLFADKSTPMAKYDRVKGMRKVLKAFPGSWILGVDALVATDALAHGAGWAAVGASSSRRWPRRPGDVGGAPLAEGFLPGTFLRPLLAFRSPAIYADWYANSISPRCDTCDRNLDLFDSTPADKSLIIAHNLHSIADFVGELLDQPADQRARWLDQERVGAFLRHAQINSVAKKVEADMTLRALCELDDPHLRETVPAGRWK